MGAGRRIETWTRPTPWLWVRQSTVEDIERIYGKLKSGLEYRGVSFYYNRVGDKRIVTTIDVTENAGIRQCRENK